jgi:hypothetical protein
VNRSKRSRPAKYSIEIAHKSFFLSLDAPRRAMRVHSDRPLILPVSPETVSQYRKGRMCRPRVISNVVRNLRSLTFIRDDNLMFSTLRHSLPGEKESMLATLTALRPHRPASDGAKYTPVNLNVKLCKSPAELGINTAARFCALQHAEIIRSAQQDWPTRTDSSRDRCKCQQRMTKVQLARAHCIIFDHRDV